jgi:hypothetical protein
MQRLNRTTALAGAAATASEQVVASPGAVAVCGQEEPDLGRGPRAGAAENRMAMPVPEPTAQGRDNGCTSLWTLQLRMNIDAGLDGCSGAQ